MNIERSFLFAFKGSHSGAKLGLGGLFSLLFFTIFFAFVVMGYLMQVLREVLEGRDGKLPEWKNLGRLFNEGIVPVLVWLIYASPILLTFCVEYRFFSADLSPASLVIMFAWAVIRLVLGLAASVVLPLALIRLAVRGSFASAFDFGEMFNFIKANPGNYFTAWALMLVVSMAACLGLLVLGIGVFFTGFIAAVIAVHLFAQAYRASTPFVDDKGGEIRASFPVPPPLG
jgi:hypothetical protein